MTTLHSLQPFDYDIQRLEFQGYIQLVVNAGFRGYDRIVPPAGEEYAFNVKNWRRKVTVSISPTGKSVRVWVDGIEIR